MSTTLINSQRQGNLFVIGSGESNVTGADYVGQMAMMAGFGDCKLYEATVRITGAGAGSVTAPLGASLLLIQSGGTDLDEVGTASFVQVASGHYVAQFKLEVVRLWRSGDLLELRMPDLESATTTGDFTLRCLVGRLRDLEAV